jgi:hypothetical protein
MSEEITDLEEYFRQFPHFRKCRRRGHRWDYGDNDEWWDLEGTGRTAIWFQEAVCERCGGVKTDRADVNRNRLDPVYKMHPEYYVHGVRVTQADMRAGEIERQIKRTRGRKQQQRRRGAA